MARYPGAGSTMSLLRNYLQGIGPDDTGADADIPDIGGSDDQEYQPAYNPLIWQAAQQFAPAAGVDPTVFANTLGALMQTEGPGTGSSPAGAYGVTQAMPNWYQQVGGNRDDLGTQINAGAAALQSKFKAVGPDPTAAAGAYFGYGKDARGMTTPVYQQRFQQNYAGMNVAPQTDTPPPGEDNPPPPPTDDQYQQMDEQGLWSQPANPPPPTPTTGPGAGGTGPSGGPLTAEDTAQIVGAQFGPQGGYGGAPTINVPGQTYHAAPVNVPGQNYNAGYQAVPGQTLTYGAQHVPGEQVTQGAQHVYGENLNAGAPHVYGENINLGSPHVTGEQVSYGAEHVPLEQYTQGAMTLHEAPLTFQYAPRAGDLTFNPNLHVFGEHWNPVTNTTYNIRGGQPTPQEANQGYMPSFDRAAPAQAIVPGTPIYNMLAALHTRTRPEQLGAGPGTAMFGALNANRPTPLGQYFRQLMARRGLS